MNSNKQILRIQKNQEEEPDYIVYSSEPKDDEENFGIDFIENTQAINNHILITENEPILHTNIHPNKHQEVYAFPDFYEVDVQ